MSSESGSVEEEEKTHPFLIDYLPDEYIQKAEKELNETADNYYSALDELRSLAESDDDLKEIDFHEDFLRQFLRQSKYDVERSLKRLQDFIKFRKTNEDLFFKHVQDIARTPDYKYCTPLPWRCRDGCTITIFEYSKWDPSGITLEEFSRVGRIVFQQSLRNPLAQINGYKMIVDWKDSNLGQLKFTSPTYLYAAFKAYLVCTPCRVKEIHFVNGSSIMNAIWTIVRPFMTEKMKNRFVFHSAPEDLLNYFPKHAIPVQYGGDLEDYYMGDWMKEANSQQRLSTIRGQCNTFTDL